MRPHPHKALASQTPGSCLSSTSPDPQVDRSPRGVRGPIYLSWTVLSLLVFSLLAPRGGPLSAGAVHAFGPAVTPEHPGAPIEAGGANDAGGANKPKEREPGREQSKEYQVKAAFLYNFISYTTWPKDELPSDSKGLIVAVVGPNPFGKGLEGLLKTKKAHGRKLVTKFYPQLPKQLDAHVIFTAHDDAKFRKQVLARTQGRSVLVIGEHKNFALSGGHVGFYLDKGKVRFEVNLVSLRQSKLSMSSQLLKLAKIVKK